NITHDYGTPGIYTVAIRGDFPKIRFENSGDRQKILSIEQWGDIAWTSMWKSFQGCSNLELNATDTPNLSSLTSLDYMFQNVTSFNSNIGNWNVSNVQSMTNMFTGVTLSTANYDALLNGWSSQALQTGVTFDAGNSQYC